MPPARSTAPFATASFTMPSTRSSWRALMIGPSAHCPAFGSPTGSFFAFVDQPLGEVARDLAVREHRAGRHADLALVQVGAPGDARGGDIEVGVVEHDGGVLAAELERHLLQVPARELADAPPGRGRAGEGDHRARPDRVIIASPAAAPPGSTCSSPRGSPAASNSRASMKPPVTGVCGSGLSTHRVAERERRRDRARRQDQREVERRDHADHAVRHAPREAHALRAARQHQAGRLRGDRRGLDQDAGHEVQLEVRLRRDRRRSRARSTGAARRRSPRAAAPRGAAPPRAGRPASPPTRPARPRRPSPPRARPRRRQSRRS